MLGLLQPQGHLPSTRLYEGPGHADLASRRLDSITLLTTDPEGPGPNMDTQTAPETSPPCGGTWGATDHSPSHASQPDTGQGHPDFWPHPHPSPAQLWNRQDWR